MEETWEQGEAPAEAAEQHWPMRPLLLAALGAVAGLAFHFILGGDLPRDVSAARMAALGFVVVTVGLLGFTLERRRWPLALAFSILCGGIAAAVLYWNGDTAGWSATEHWRVVSVALGLPRSSALRLCRMASASSRVAKLSGQDGALPGSSARAGPAAAMATRADAQTAPRIGRWKNRFISNDIP